MRWSSLGIACALFSFLSSAAFAFDRAAWIQDFVAVQSALTRDYPNLEWAVDRGMDLPAMEKRTLEGLEDAETDEQAKEALRRFISSFADGHLSLTWPDGKGAARGTSGSLSTCGRLGFRDVPDQRALGALLPGYRALDATEPSAAGTVVLSGSKLAILRVAFFGPSLSNCEQALAEAAYSPEHPCDAACAGRVRLLAGARFVSGMAQRIRDLAKLEPDAILIDLSANGGGDDSAVVLARMFDPSLPTPVVARMRGKPLASDISAMRAQLRHGADVSSVDQQALLRNLESQLAAAEAEARRSCDRTSLWQGRPPRCSGTVRGPFFAGGLTRQSIDPDVPGNLASIISTTSHYPRSPLLWSGPMLVLVDGDTASAAELFAAMLQDDHRALVIGAPTFGSGCGWMLEPHAAVLPNSHGQLRMPDCLRLRANGDNEVDGITPDLLIAFRPRDTQRQRGARFVEAWPKIETSLNTVASDGP